MRYGLFVGLIFSSCLLLSTCGGNSASNTTTTNPTTPTGTTGLSGSWTGTTISVSDQISQFRMTLAQTGSSVTGTWRILTSTGAIDSEGGVSGIVADTFAGSMTINGCPTGTIANVQGTGTGNSLIWKSTGFSSSNFECRTNSFTIVVQK